MDATMQIVAEKGLSSLSTRLAARRAGVSDGLMYRFFASKDDLLYACFESVHKEIAALFSDLPQQFAAMCRESAGATGMLAVNVDDIGSVERKSYEDALTQISLEELHRIGLEPVEIVHQIWEKYFRFLIQNDYRTLFYFEYWNSRYIKDVMARDGEARSSYFESLDEIIQMGERLFHLSERIPPDILWTYILDTSGTFAGRIIRGELPGTDKTIEEIWKLMRGGLSGLFSETLG